MYQLVASILTLTFLLGTNISAATTVVSLSSESPADSVRSEQKSPDTALLAVSKGTRLRVITVDKTVINGKLFSVSADSLTLLTVRGSLVPVPRTDVKTIARLKKGEDGPILLGALLAGLLGTVIYTVISNKQATTKPMLTSDRNRSPYSRNFWMIPVAALVGGLAGACADSPARPWSGEEFWKQKSGTGGIVWRPGGIGFSVSLKF